jgi:hypothetical protein
MIQDVLQVATLPDKRALFLSSVTLGGMICPRASCDISCSGFDVVIVSNSFTLEASSGRNHLGAEKTRLSGNRVSIG